MGKINFGFILVYKNVFILGAKIQMISFAYDKKCDFEFEAKGFVIKKPTLLVKNLLS